MVEVKLILCLTGLEGEPLRRYALKGVSLLKYIGGYVFFLFYAGYLLFGTFTGCRITEGMLIHSRIVILTRELFANLVDLFAREKNGVLDALRIFE